MDSTAMATSGSAARILVISALGSKVGADDEDGRVNDSVADRRRGHEPRIVPESGDNCTVGAHGVAPAQTGMASNAVCVPARLRPVAMMTCEPAATCAKWRPLDAAKSEVSWWRMVPSMSSPIKDRARR